MLLEMGMIPNIKQRTAAVNRGKPSRSRAARLFNKYEYKQRDMIEGIFGVRSPSAINYTVDSSAGTTAAASARSGPSPGISRC